MIAQRTKQAQRFAFAVVGVCVGRVHEALEVALGVAAGEARDLLLDVGRAGATPAPRLRRCTRRGLPRRLRLRGPAARADGPQRGAPCARASDDLVVTAAARRLVAVVLVVRTEPVGPLLRPAAFGRRPAASSRASVPSGRWNAHDRHASPTPPGADGRRCSRRADHRNPAPCSSPADDHAAANRRCSPGRDPIPDPCPSSDPTRAASESAGFRAGGRPLPLGGRGRRRSSAMVLESGERAVIVPTPEKQAPPPLQMPARRGRLVENPAATYSPGGSPPKYHRRWRS